MASKKIYDVDVYKDVKKEWRWKVDANNGNTIGGSTEGYKNKKDLIDNIETLKECLESFLNTK